MMFNLWLSVFVRNILSREDNNGNLNSLLVAISVLATIPCMFIFSFLASWLLSEAEMLKKSARRRCFGQTIVEQVKGDDEDGNEMQCAVCLYEVCKGEKYRVLPKCKHVYHVSCIDSWLQTNPSCPICRCEVEMVSDEEKCRFNVLKSSLFSFFERFCKPFFGFSTDSIENSHYIF
ncbi:hypothetical protein LIER_11419 [Lithospermum erythrorhizon]|uniref:RING-type domain-containing protein n=1 Tax=Lithospermum erythrorhizon TaxID=34254 RepID=A0AAV3PPE4_LITER